MTDPIFGPFTIVILLITMIHFPILGIILVIWAQDQLMKKDLEVYNRLERIAKDLGVLNRTFPPQKGLFLFSWLVYQKRVRDYYIKYNNYFRRLEGLHPKEPKPDSIPRFFYGGLFGKPSLSMIITTEDDANPFIMVTQKSEKKSKNSVSHYRVIYYKSDDLDLPKCEINPTYELIDSIMPDPSDINFVSDEDFSKKFDLMGENEPKIRALFNENIRRIISANPEWVWEFNNDQIMIKYLISGSTISELEDIKPSLGELAKIHKELKNINWSDIPTQLEIDKDTPEEILDNKLYRKRMATFGCAIGCGTILIPFALFMLYGFFSTFDFKLLGPFLFMGVPGFLLFRWGRLEWKRNKQLKADGKVRDSQ